MSKQILLVDDHEIVRIGLRYLLDNTELVIAREASDARSAVACLKESPFDVVVVDPKLPRGYGFEMIKEMQAIRPDQRIVLFSEIESQSLGCNAILLKLSGLISKLAPWEVIRDQLLRVANGEKLWSKEDLRRSSRVELNHRILDTQTGIPLTKREMAVLQKLATGMTNQDIASTLGISYETVKEHVRQILKKIGVSDRTQAAVWAVRNKLA